jgi:hypothetical protein
LTSDQGAHESFNEEIHLIMQQALNSHNFLRIMTSSWQMLGLAMTGVRGRALLVAPGHLQVERHPRTMEMMIVHHSSMNIIGWQRRYV